MDALTKLKMLSSQLEDPKFADEFFKGFEEFVNKQKENEFEDPEFSVLKLKISKCDLQYNNKLYKKISKKIEVKTYGISEVAIAA